jgi:SsrA-binding protein
MSDIARNRKAFHDYEVLETIEAGIALVGTEVKSCRASQVQLLDGYAVIRQGEIWLLNVHITPYSHGNRANHEPMRERRLLLHKREIAKLKLATDQRGQTLIPLAMYYKSGKVKVALGLCRGKRQADKRDSKRAMQQAMRRRE